MTNHDHRHGFDFDAQAEPELANRLCEVLELLAEHGFDGMARAMETLFNEAMKLERADVLGALPNERTANSRGYANGLKPKTVRTRVGDLHFDVPQTLRRRAGGRRGRLAAGGSGCASPCATRC